MFQWVDSIREAWEKLSERERRLLGITGGVFLVMIIFIAVWTTSSALAEVEEERDEIRSVLADLERASDMLDKRMAERKAVEERFRQKPPALAAFVEGKAKEQGLEVRQVIEEPTKDLSGYKKTSVRASFQGVSLRPVMRLLASIEEERLPIAVERIQIQHYTPGDTFKVDVGIAGYEAPKKSSSGGGDKDEKQSGADASEKKKR